MCLHSINWVHTAAEIPVDNCILQFACCNFRRRHGTAIWPATARNCRTGTVRRADRKSRATMRWKRMRSRGHPPGSLAGGGAGRTASGAAGIRAPAGGSVLPAAVLPVETLPGQPESTRAGVRPAEPGTATSIAAVFATGSTYRYPVSWLPVSGCRQSAPAP